MFFTFLLGGFGPVHAALTRSVMLTWEGDSEVASGYRIYYGTTPGQYTSSVEVGPETTVTLHGLRATQAYYFVVTVYDASHLESEPSEEASVPPTIGAVINVPNGGVVNQNGAVPLGLSFSGTDEQGVHVQWLVNGTKVAETSLPPYQLDWQAVDPGTYHLIAIVSDDTGEVLRSQGVQLTVKKFAVEKLERSPSGEVRLTVTGAPGHRNRVYFSEDLAQWALLTTVDNVSGTVEVEDAGAAQSTQRFYRVVAEAL